jgi:hypothetical protein
MIDTQGEGKQITKVKKVEEGKLGFGFSLNTWCIKQNFLMTARPAYEWIGSILGFVATPTSSPL